VPSTDNLPHLLYQLSLSGAPRQKAVADIKKLADDPKNKITLVQGGVLPPLVRILNEVCYTARRGVGPASSFLTIGCVQDHGAPFANAINAVWYLSRAEANLEAMMDSGVCSPLLQIVRHNAPSNRLRALNALGNIAMARSNCLPMVQMGMVPILIGVIREERGEIRMKAVKALNNLSLKEEVRALIMSTALAQCLTEVIEQDMGGPREEAIKVLTNLALDAAVRKALLQPALGVPGGRVSSGARTSHLGSGRGIMRMLVAVTKEDAFGGRKQALSALMNLGHERGAVLAMEQAGLLDLVLPLLKAAKPVASWGHNGSESRSLSILVLMAQDGAVSHALKGASAMAILEPLLLSDHYQVRGSLTTL
jgi:hypothetical protein